MTVKFTVVMTAEDVTPEILELAEYVYDGWFAHQHRVHDWEDFVDRLDGHNLADESTLDLGQNMASLAIEAIKKHIQKYAKS